MRMNSDPEPDDPLLEAVLRDHDWQTVSAAFKTEALATFRARQRVRRLTRWAGGLAVLAMLLAGISWFGWRTVPRQTTLAQRKALEPPPKPHFLTDKELLAAFPKGSCFIAEVDGKKELIFLDPKAQRTYLAKSGLPSN